MGAILLGHSYRQHTTPHPLVMIPMPFTSRIQLPHPVHPTFRPSSSRLARLLLLLRTGVEAYQMHFWGNSLVVHWLGLCASTAGAQFRFLVEELRSCMPHRTAGKNALSVFTEIFMIFSFVLLMISTLIL